LRSTAADGTTLSSFRESQSFRTSGVLHPACLGLEGQSHRRVRELAFQRVLQCIQRTNPIKSGVQHPAEFCHTIKGLEAPNCRSILICPPKPFYSVTRFRLYSGPTLGINRGK